MNRTVAALLAIASLFAPCGWCSGEAQGSGIPHGVEETTDEDMDETMTLLQVTINLMPKLEATSPGSPDEVWNMTENLTGPVAISHARESMQASRPSTRVFSACIALGLVAAGLLSIAFLHENFLLWWPRREAATTIPVRLMHVTVVSKAMLDSTKYACLIPLALDLAGELGWSPAVSSMLIGSVNTGRFIGNVLARVLQPLLGHYYSRQGAVGAMAIAATIEVLVCVPLLIQPTSSLHGYLILGTRFLSGICSGVAAMADVIVRKCTNETEQTPLSLSVGIAVSVGMLFGPLMSTMVLTFLGRQVGSMEACDMFAVVMLVGAPLTALSSIMCSFTLPTSIEDASRGAKGDAGAGKEAVADKNCEAKEAAAGESSTQKEVLTLVAAVGCLVVCGLSTVSIDVATSMLLELQFAWSPKAVGYAIAAGLGPTGLLSTGCILVMEYEVVRVRTLVGLLLMQAVTGVVFLYDGFIFNFRGPQLLCSDFLLYPSVSVLSCVINGEVFKMATKFSAIISPESAQMVVNMAAEGLDILSVTSARWLITVGGRNGYATSQAVLVGMLFMAFQSLSSEGGSEAATVDAMKAVPAGGKDAVESSAEDCAQPALREGDRGAGVPSLPASGTSVGAEEVPERTGTAAALLLEGVAK